MNLLSTWFIIPFIILKGKIYSSKFLLYYLSPPPLNRPFSRSNQFQMDKFKSHATFWLIQYPAMSHYRNVIGCKCSFHFDLNHQKLFSKELEILREHSKASNFSGSDNNLYFYSVQKHWVSFTKHAYALICAWNVSTNDFKNKPRFTKKFILKCILYLRKIIGTTETTHTQKALRPYNHVKILYFI